VIADIPVSGKSGPQLTPGIEQRLVDRVAVGAQLYDQRIQRNIVEHDRDEDHALVRGQLFIDGPVQRAEQVPPFGLARGVEAEPVRQPVPVLGVERDGRVAPEVPPDLGRHLEDDELIGPGREPALSPELPELAGNRDQRIGRRLMGQVIKLGAGDPQPWATPPDLTLRDPHQHRMQPDQRRLPPRAGTGEQPQPIG
jgi:hypothetical protein